MQRPIEKPIGTPVTELDTPALLVDLERLDANIAASGGDAPVRAAVWIHNTAAIARRQLALPHVIGIAVRGVAEAEAFAAAGFDDIRILRPLVTASSRRRAEALARSIRIVAGLPDDPAAAEDAGLWGADVLDDAVTVSARITSVPEPGRAIHDCGQKAIGRDFGNPRVLHQPGRKASAGSAEHGIIGYPERERPFAIGDWLQLVPADAATVFALHDFAFGVRDQRLEAVWPVTARGAFQ